MLTIMHDEPQSIKMQIRAKEKGYIPSSVVFISRDKIYIWIVCTTIMAIDARIRFHVIIITATTITIINHANIAHITLRSLCALSREKKKAERKEQGIRKEKRKSVENGKEQRNAYHLNLNTTAIKQ